MAGRSGVFCYKGFVTVLTYSRMERYVCQGTCGGSVSEEEYAAGKHVCGTPGCTHEGKPFVRVEDDEESKGGE